MGLRTEQLIISSPAATGNQVHTWGSGARHCRLADTQYFTVADNATHDIGDVDWWVWVLVYFDSIASTYHEIVAKSASGVNGAFELTLNGSANRFEFYFMNGTTTHIKGSLVSANTSIVVKTWYSLLAYHDAINNQIGLSINGAAYETAASAAPAGVDTSAFTIGSRAAGNLPTDGRIAGVATGKTPAGIAAQLATLKTFFGDGSSKPNFDSLTSANKTDYGLTTGNGSWYDLDETAATDNAVDSVNAVNLTATNSPGTAYGPGDSKAWTPAAGKVTSVGHTAAAGTAHAQILFGITDFTAARCITIASQDAQGTSVADRRHDNGFISLLNVGGAVLEDSGVTSTASGEITINWTTVASAANRYSILLLGGDGVQAKVGTLTTVGTGLLAVSGVGFEPDCAEFLGIAHATDPPTSQATAIMGVGFTNFTDSAAVGVSSKDAESTSITNRYQSATACFATVFNDTLIESYEPSSTNSDGFVINVIASSADDTSYLALKGVGASVVNDKTVPGATGLQNLGVNGAKAAMFISVEHATADAVQAHNVISIGFTDGTLQASANATDEDALGTTDANRVWTESDLLTIYSEVPTNLADAQLDNLSVGSINWVDADAGAQAFYAFLLGDPISQGKRNRWGTPSGSRLSLGRDIRRVA